MQSDGKRLTMAIKGKSLDSWIALAGLAVSMLVQEGLIRSYGVLYVWFLELFQQGPFNTSWVATTFALVTAVLSPFSGWLFDRYPIWRMFMASSLIGCLSIAACSFSPSLPVVIVTWGIGQGTANSLTYIGSVAGTTKIFPKHQSIASGVIWTCGGIGGISFPFLFNFLVELFGNRGAILIIGGIYLHILIASTVLWTYCSRKERRKTDEEERLLTPFGDTRNQLPEKSSAFEQIVQKDSLLNEENKRENIKSKNEIKFLIENENMETVSMKTSLDEKIAQDFESSQHKMTKENDREGKYKSAMSALLSVKFIFIIIYIFAMTFSFMGFNLYLPAIAQEIGLDAHKGALLLSILAGSDLIGRLGLGFLGNMKCTYFYLILMVNMVTGAVMLRIFSFSPGFGMFAVTVAVVGLFVPSSNVWLILLTLDATGQEHAGIGVGVGNVAFGLGIVAAPLAIGGIYEATGTYMHTPSLAFGGLLVAALCLLMSSGLLTACCRKTIQGRKKT